MDKTSARLLAAAIAFAAVLYFLVHLHAAVSAPPYRVVVFNTVTGAAEPVK
jgi:uncharacterized membrane protein YdjX (TVP38/TMEM64 family)